MPTICVARDLSTALEVLTTREAGSRLEDVSASDSELTFDPIALAGLSSTQEDSVAARLHGADPVLIDLAQSLRDRA